MLHREVIHQKKVDPGASPDEDVDGSVEVTIQVRYLPYSDNELRAHYLTKQLVREVVEDIDRRGLNRVMAEDVFRV